MVAPVEELQEGFAGLVSFLAMQNAYVRVGIAEGYDPETAFLHGSTHLGQLTEELEYLSKMRRSVEEYNNYC